MSTIGDMIRGACEAHGISLRELARRMNRSHVFLCDVAAGRRDLSLDYLHEVCNALQVACNERDPWIAAAGLVPDDLWHSLRAHPERWDDLRKALR